MKKSDDIIKQAENEVKKVQKTTKKDIKFYSSGVTLLDLCLGGGFGVGYISNIIGGESSGKTLFACETIGCNNYSLKNFDHVIDNAESGFTLDTQFLWNFKVNLIEPRSTLVEHFEYNVEKVLNRIKEKDFIYVLDSLDGLSSESEQKKYKQKIQRIKKKIEEEKEEKEKGDYGTAKAKGMSEFFRILNSKINKKNMHLIIISQIRDKVGVMFGKKVERTGGKALNFYSAQIVWLYTISKNEKSVIINDKKYKRVSDTLVKAEVTKNKLGKAFRSCYLFVNSDIGVDTIKSNIYFLYNLITPEGKIRKGGNLIWDDNEYSVEKLLNYIDENNLDKKLENRVIKLWNEIEEKSSIHRKRKYR